MRHSKKSTKSDKQCTTAAVCICRDMYINALWIARNYIWQRTKPSSASSPVGRFLCLVSAASKRQPATCRLEGPQEVRWDIFIKALYPFLSFQFFQPNMLRPGDLKDLRWDIFFQPLNPFLILQLLLIQGLGSPMQYIFSKPCILSSAKGAQGN